MRLVSALPASELGLARLRFSAGERLARDVLSHEQVFVEETLDMWPTLLQEYPDQVSLLSPSPFNALSVAVDPASVSFDPARTTIPVIADRQQSIALLAARLSNH